MASEEAIRAAFALFDQKCDGKISAAALRSILTRPVDGGARCTAEQAEWLIKEFDSEGCGELSTDECARAWASLSAAPTAGVSNGSRPECRLRIFHVNVSANEPTCP